MSELPVVCGRVHGGDGRCGPAVDLLLAIGAVMHLLCQANALRIPLADKSVHMCVTRRHPIKVLEGLWPRRGSEGIWSANH